MTALNFVLMENLVAISMDTLSLRQDVKTPYKFVSKFCHLPQMNCVICGTGNMGAIIRWIAFVQERIAANGIYQLDLLTQSTYPEFMKNETVSDDLTTTLYQFGLSELDGLFHGYAYRSTSKFKSEEIVYGIGVKPPDVFISDTALDMGKVNFSLEDIEKSFISIMEKQKKHDDELPIENRMGIGGHIQMIMLTESGTITKSLKPFDDFEEQLDFINGSLS